MLVRAWGLMGLVAAALGLGLLLVLLRAGWAPGAPTGSGTPRHLAYLQATTASFAAIVACQIGTAFAARTDRTSLRRVGLFGNRMLVWGIAFEVAFAAAVIYAPPLQIVFGTAALPGWVVACLLPMPAACGASTRSSGGRDAAGRPRADAPERHRRRGRLGSLLSAGGAGRARPCPLTLRATPFGRPPPRAHR